MPDPLMQDIEPPDNAIPPEEMESSVLPIQDVPLPPPVSPVAEQLRVQRIQAAALVILATAAVLSLIYVGKLFLIVLLASILVSFVLAPLVDLLGEFRLPRALAAFFAVLLLVVLVCTLSYISYARALDFTHELPKYKERIRQVADEIRRQAKQFENTTETVLPSEPEEKNAVTLKQTSGLTDFLSRNASSVTEIALAVTFIPFLVYFMLSWQDHVRASSVMLFRMENRNTAYVTLGLIADMIRSFIVGNFIIGLFLSGASMIAFGLMGLPYFYFLGFISGFLSIVPYLGVILAVLPPLIAGLGYLTTVSFFLVCGLVVGLHLFAMNVLYPKILGKRLRLNPLAITIALLFWGWLWGAMGLILAVPITGAWKIICDHVDRLRPYGAWMGE